MIEAAGHTLTKGNGVRFGSPAAIACYEAATLLGNERRARVTQDRRP
jgi:hypothetical protein